MATKGAVEHKARHIKMDTWADKLRKIEDMCAEMQEGGWSLLSMAFSDSKNAVLVFSRPKG